MEYGRLYLVKEPDCVVAKEAFRDLLNNGHNGHVASWTGEDEFRSFFDGDFGFFYLLGEGEKDAHPDLGEIERCLVGLPRGCAVLIEKIEKLVFKNGFDKTLSFVCRLRDLSYLRSHVVILSVDPQILTRKELRLLDNETNELEVKHTLSR
jgi:hypothetical protein